MSKVLIGAVLGAILGFIDSTSSLLTPEAGNFWDIAPWSSLKGVIVGVVAGFYARKVVNMRGGIIVGLVVATIMALLVIWGNVSAGLDPYWVEIMLPGMIVGIILGYATQKYGGTPASKEA